MNIVGQFNEQGNCDVDHDSNYLIVHPDILVSGTRVFVTCYFNTIIIWGKQVLPPYNFSVVTLKWNTLSP